MCLSKLKSSICTCTYILHEVTVLLPHAQRYHPRPHGTPLWGDLAGQLKQYPAAFANAKQFSKVDRTAGAA